MSYNQKKQIFLTFFLVLFLTCSSLASAMELKYPKMGNVEISSSTTFVEYAVYIFNFAIIVSGVIAFGVLIFAGIKILTSPDNPETRNDAKSKIIGALLGIVFLLSSYLILKTIGFEEPDLTDLTPVSGVYLTDTNGKVHYVADSSTDLGFISAEVKFISPKEELTAVYDVSDNKVDNAGIGSGGAFSGKTIYFLWNRPGLYLYPNVNFGGRPRCFNSSISSLTTFNFNDSASSLKFNNGTSTSGPGGLFEVYGALLFGEDSYRGEKCDYRALNDAQDLSAAAGNFPAIGTKTLSSFYLFKTYAGPVGGPALPSIGNATFYDHIDCKGNKYPVQVTAGSYYDADLSHISFDGSFDGNKLPVENNILSFEINGNFGVILNTEKAMKGRCQLFRKPANTNCIRTLKGEYVYGEAIGVGGNIIQTYRIKSFFIFPDAQ